MKYGPPNEFNCPKCGIKMKFFFHFGYDQKCQRCEIVFVSASSLNPYKFALKIVKDIRANSFKYNEYYGNSFEECMRQYKLKAFE